MLCGNFAVYPGTMRLAGMAVNLLGDEHVNPGSWPGPVYLKDVSVEDAQTFLALVREYDPLFRLRMMHYSVLVSTSLGSTTCHEMPCIEVSGAPLEVMKMFTRAMNENRFGEKAYELRHAAGACLQGQDVVSGWMLIEFWKPDYMPFVEYLNERLKATRPTGD